METIYKQIAELECERGEALRDGNFPRMTDCDRAIERLRAMEDRKEREDEHKQEDAEDNSFEHDNEVGEEFINHSRMRGIGF